MQLALRLVYDINEDLQKLLVQNLEIKWNSIESVSEWVDVDIYTYIYIYSSGFTEFPVLIVRHNIIRWIYDAMTLFPDWIEDEIFAWDVSASLQDEGRET